MAYNPNFKVERYLQQVQQKTTKDDSSGQNESDKMKANWMLKPRIIYPHKLHIILTENT